MPDYYQLLEQKKISELISELEKEFEEPTRYAPIGVLYNTELFIREMNDRTRTRKSVEKSFTGRTIDEKVISLEKIINKSIKNPDLEEPSFTNIGFSKHKGESKVRLTHYGPGTQLLRVLGFEKNKIIVRLSYAHPTIIQKYFKQSKCYINEVSFEQVRTAYGVVCKMNEPATKIRRCIK